MPTPCHLRRNDGSGAGARTVTTLGSPDLGPFFAPTAVPSVPGRPRWPFRPPAVFIFSWSLPARIQIICKEAFLVMLRPQQTAAGPFPGPQCCLLCVALAWPWHGPPVLFTVAKADRPHRCCVHGSVVLSVHVVQPVSRTSQCLSVPPWPLGQRPPSCRCDVGNFRSLMEGTPTVSVFL